MARSLPLTWTTTVTVSEVRYLSSQVGHSSVAPRCSNISLARCGAKGFKSFARIIRSSPVAPCLYNSLTYSMSAATAVLNW